MTTKDFSFQGKVRLGTRLAGGRPGALRWVGDAPKCDVSLTTETEERKESYSGQRLTSARLQKSKGAEIALTLNWASPENLALGLYGSVNTVAAGSVTGETLPAGLVAGVEVMLEHGGVSALVLTDSTGSPVTLVEGTNYELASANGGVILIKDVGSLTQPFKAAYSHTKSVDVAMFTSTPPERFLFLDGVNTVDNTPVRLQLYRVKFDPASNVPTINEGFGTLELSGSVLFDDEADLDPELGGFGKIEQPEAVA